MKKLVLFIFMLMPILALAQIDESKMDRYLDPVLKVGEKVVFKDSLQYNSQFLTPATHQMDTSHIPAQ